ncbi:hypothetical protein HanPI659440_Chr14g0572971 [Helianthus annuus]|nr:hypothetical protein HanPI659440_Chr14g0572971 [Helianthus annuus]
MFGYAVIIINKIQNLTKTKKKNERKKERLLSERVIDTQNSVKNPAFRSVELEFF